LDKEKIVSGFKRKITKDMAMTGKELCEMLGLDYEAIINSRIHQQIRNLDYFLDGLLKIDVVRKTIINKLENPTFVQTKIPLSE
jgi:hypothetical protein